MKKSLKYIGGVFLLLLLLLGGFWGYVSYNNYLRQEPSFTVSGSPDLLRDTQINVHIYRYDVTLAMHNVAKRNIHTLLKNGEIRPISPMFGDIYDIYILHHGKVGHIQIAKEVYEKMGVIDRIYTKNEIVLSQKNGKVWADFVPFRAGKAVRGSAVDVPLNQFVAKSEISNSPLSFVKVKDRNQLKQYISDEF